MKIVYHTMTGNAKRLALAVGKATGLKVYPLKENPSGEYLLITHTIGDGEVPSDTQDFLKERGEDMLGVVSTGSFHWGDNFGNAARIISREYGVDLVRIVNKSGTRKDVEGISEWILTRKS